MAVTTHHNVEWDYTQWRSWIAVAVVFAIGVFLTFSGIVAPVETIPFADTNFAP